MTRVYLAYPSARREPVPSWQVKAACATADGALFDGHDLAAAFAYCDRCPVRTECLAQGRHEGADGVWGGALLSVGREVTRRLARVSDDAVREWHVFYVLGDRDPSTLAGEREYQHRNYLSRRRA